MPVYGKGRKPKSPVHKISEIRREGRKRTYHELTRGWYTNRTPFHELKEIFGGLFKHPDFISNRFKQLDRPVVVWDWGCGAATTIEGLAHNYGDKVRAYGTSNEAYKDWVDVDKAKLIHATAEDQLRYFKPGSVDLIYSNIALCHLIPDRTLLPYLDNLVSKLSIGGKLVFNDFKDETKRDLVIQKKLRKQFKRTIKVEFDKSRNVFYITRKK